MIRMIYVCILSMIMFSCLKGNDLEYARLPEPLMHNYCALGASTAALGWQTSVASVVATKFVNYAVPSARWTLIYSTKMNYGGCVEPYADNVMHNQLLRLLADKLSKGYLPDLITIMCGINDRLYIETGNIGDENSVYSTNIADISPEDWLVHSEAPAMRLTFYGSVRYCIEKLMAEFPNAKIIIFTVQNCSGSIPNDYLVKLNTILAKIAKHYDLSLIDVYNDSGITAEAKYYNSDMMHLNFYGERVLADFVISKLKELYYKPSSPVEK